VSGGIRADFHPAEPLRAVKCLVWDLDRTLWDGLLVENPNVQLRAGVDDVLRGLDERGILQSIASRNDQQTALSRLRALGVDEYFLWPQINWGAKSVSIQAIATRLNIGLGAIAFIDDEQIERDEVAFAHPPVICLDAACVRSCLNRAELAPAVVTDDARRRRQMMRASFARDADAERFTGPPEAFLASLRMVFTIRPATSTDLDRIQELTLRTRRLNATGYDYGREALLHMAGDPRYRLLVAQVEDRYGTYGTVGVALVEIAGSYWTLKLLLISCRVMQRGLGTVLLRDVMARAQAVGAELHAEYIPTESNRAILVTYRLSGFEPNGSAGAVEMLRHDLASVPLVPGYVRIISR
jgi:FkbH-like protein